MFHNIDQNTDEWLSLRAGKVTGSAIARVMANDGKAFGDPAKKLAVDIAIEQLTGKPIGGGYSNDHMERGKEQEPIARQMYEDRYFCTVENGGFFDNGFTGCSPDGIVDSGLVEIKSVIPSVQYKRVKSGTYDPAYRWQLIFNLKESGKDWIDFVSFCANFTDDKKLIVHRMHAEQQAVAFQKIDRRLEKFRLFVDQVKSDISNDAIKVAA